LAFFEGKLDEEKQDKKKTEMMSKFPVSNRVCSIVTVANTSKVAFKSVLFLFRFR
jgi:hypothetical protein